MIKEIAQALAEGSKLWNTWLKSAERRKMSIAIDSAEKYIQVNELSGEFKDISPERKQKLLIHFAKRFFAYN